MLSREERLIVLTGPTGVGKSAFAFELAEELDAEIVSADAGQVYRGFDVGTAKPDSEDQARVRHHCIDLWNPDIRSDAMLWQRAADAAIDAIQGRGKRVLIVGGTAFYIKALLRGLFGGPDPDPEIRARLTDEFAEQGGALLHQRLADIDPAAAARIHPNDPVRLIRALEIHEQTGTPMSVHQERHAFQEQRYPYAMIGLQREREELYERINERVIRMMESGWVDETRHLLQEWGPDAPAFQLIGYREIRDQLAGRLSEAELVPKIQQASRHYAKRQLTWLRGESELRWVDAKAINIKSLA